MCFAPAMPPAIEALSLVFDNPFPALNTAPPFENCIITGALSLAAVSRTPFMVLDPVTFTAGSANPFPLHI